MANLPDLTLVIDIGKSHAKLLWVDDHGMVVDRRSRDNRSVQSPLGYPALDIAGLTDWMQQGLISSSVTHRCKRVMTCTHGAAFVALGDEGLAWDPIDYEFDGFASAPPEMAPDYLHLRDDFSSTLAPDLPAVDASRAHILQVCLNIAMNAIDAMPGGGNLNVTLSSDVRRVPGVLMRFADSGKGIADEDLTHIYEPFFTNGKAKGVGLGLTITRDIVERHHGQLVIQSPPGSGAVVDVWLPVKHEA